MRHPASLVRLLALAIVLGVATTHRGCDCGSSKPSAGPGDSGGGTTGGAAATTTVSTGGGGPGGAAADEAPGAIRAPGGTVDYPAQSGIQAFAPVADPPAPNNLNLVRVSGAFLLKTARPVFAKPVTVTLNLDRAKLPPALTPEQVYPVLALGGQTERLRIPVKLDLAAGTVSYELTRSFPLVAAQAATGPAAAGAGGAGGAASPVSTFVVIDSKKLYPIDPSAEPTLYATEAHQTDAVPLAANILQKLAAVRQKYESLGYSRAAPMRIEIADLRPGIAGQASGGAVIELNFATLTGNPAFTHALVAHEYFHSLQQKMLIDALAAYKLTDAASTPGDARWVDEGTADTMEYFVAGVTPVEALARLKLNFGYRSLNAYDQAKDEIHEYQTAAFFHYIAARYGDLRPVLADYYAQLMRPSKPVPPPRSGPQSPDDSMEALLQEMDVMDSIKVNPYRTMDEVLRARHKKSLRRMFLESLMALYVRKDLEPFTTGAASVFGPPMELRVPADKLLQMSCPFRIGDSWTDERDTDAFGGEGMCIVRAVEITRMAVPDEKKGGALQLTLSCPSAADANDLVMIAFPIGADGKVRPHSTGTLKRPARIADWQSVPRAIVWVINTIPDARAGIRLKAAVRMPSDLHLTYHEANRGPGTGEGNRLVVASPALARLAADDKRNGLRFKLYRSMKAEGPFEPVTSNWLEYDVVVDLFKGDAKSKSTLLAPDKIQIFDPNVYRDKQPRQPGPFYYRVGQTLLVNEGNGIKAEGEEVLSNILGPGAGAIRLIPNTSASDNPIHLEGNWATFTVALSTAAQNWDCPNAHFTVKTGTFTGHYWSGRMQDGRQYGIVDTHNYGTVGAQARIRVPYRPSGNEVTIEADGGNGFTATKTLRLPEKPALVAREQKVLDEIAKTRTAMQAQVAKELPEAEKALADAKKAIDDFIEAKKQKKILFGSMSQLRRQLMEKQTALAQAKDVRAPYVDAKAWEYHRNSFVTSDPAIDLQMYQLDIKRADAEQAIDLEKTKAELALANEILADPDSKDQHERLKGNLPMIQGWVTDAQARLPNSRFIKVNMIRSAERTGDAALVRQGFEIAIADIDRRMKEKPEDTSLKNDKFQKLREMANALVILTGDREQSATLWQQADALLGIKEDPAKKPKPALPAWFP